MLQREEKSYCSSNNFRPLSFKTPMEPQSCATRQYQETCTPHPIQIKATGHVITLGSLMGNNPVLCGFDKECSHSPTLRVNWFLRLQRSLDLVWCGHKVSGLLCGPSVGWPCGLFGLVFFFFLFLFKDFFLLNFFQRLICT